MKIIYQTVILPSVEYSSVIYGCMIPDYISNKLESVQKQQALKIIFGWTVNYENLISNGTIQTLKECRKRSGIKICTKIGILAEVWLLVY